MKLTKAFLAMSAREARASKKEQAKKPAIKPISPESHLLKETKALKAYKLKACEEKR